MSQWRARRRAIGDASLGLVPTMGALHIGHLRLVERSVRENPFTAATIFVNPSQFNDPADLARYPRTLEADLEMLRSAGAADVVVPSVEDMYPHGYRMRIESNGSASGLEGEHRPGFFQGVMTVVMKLFHLTSPTRAYFGEKDFQQLRVITEMVEEFVMPIEIIPCATVREPSGLAESSRNRLLSPEGRERAAVIYRALSTAPGLPEARAMLEQAGLRVDYVEERWGRRLAAAFLEGVRLIDNVPIP